MGTRNHPSLPNHAYFITTTTRQRIPVFADAIVAQAFIAQLLTSRSELGFLVPAYVVMPDHVHLIIVPGPDFGLPRIMQYIKGRFARRFNDSNGGQGNLWQARYYETAIRDGRSIQRRIEYIEQNPVKAGLASHASSYAYSSASRPTGDRERYLSGEWMIGAPG